MFFTVIGLGVLATILGVEVAFRAYHAKRYGRPYHVSIKFPWKRMHVVSHPYLSFAYRKNEVIDRNQRLPYFLHPNRFWSFQQPLHLNNYGFFGPNWAEAKAPDTIRIVCLGASTTANTIADDESEYSYPALLQDTLTQNLREAGSSKTVEVMNFGIGGRVSPELLITFYLTIVHMKPDYLVLYHGFNDLHLHLMEDFATDYSHGRLSLGEVLPQIKKGYLLPKIRFWHSYECLKDKLIGTGNVRNDLLKSITAKQPDIDRPFARLDIQQANIRNILLGCRQHGIVPIVGTYAFFRYADDPVSMKYQSGVSIENGLLRDLSNELSVSLCEIAETIPQDREYFVDAIHFTPLGMRFVADAFAERLLEHMLVAPLPPSS
jgi:lysophospholipase L1-like esterase